MRTTEDSPTDHHTADSDITTLIARARDGGDDAQARLFEAVHERLYRMASRSPYVGRPGETMQPTALVGELWLQFHRSFPDAPDSISESRATFYRTAGLAMRTILRDYWRGKVAKKRGGGVPPIALNEATIGAAPGPGADRTEFLSLDEAMTDLQQANPRGYDLVNLRYFAGRTLADAAELMDISLATAKKEWRVVKTWLLDRLDETRE